MRTFLFIAERYYQKCQSNEGEKKKEILIYFTYAET